LVYQELGNSNTLYELRYSATVSARAAGAGRDQQRSSVAQTCQPQPQAMTLEAWQAENFAAVKKTAEAYVTQCADAFTARLPQVFS